MIAGGVVSPCGPYIREREREMSARLGNARLSWSDLVDQRVMYVARCRRVPYSLQYLGLRTPLKGPLMPTFFRPDFPLWDPAHAAQGRLARSQEKESTRNNTQAIHCTSG